MVFNKKKYGCKFIGMAEYINYYDRNNLKDNEKTYTNNYMNWTGGEYWSIQINYKNLYMIDNVNIFACIQGSQTILNFATFFEKKKLQKI